MDIQILKHSSTQTSGSTKMATTMSYRAGAVAGVFLGKVTFAPLHRVEHRQRQWVSLELRWLFSKRN